MKRRLKRLEKLQRLREIARVQAMREAADAFGALAKARAVEERSAQLSASEHTAKDGESLHDHMRFSAALTDLRADAQRSVLMADEAAQSAQTTLSLRSRERDLVNDRLADARRLAKRAEHGPSPALARSLNSSGTTPTAARRAARHTP